MKILAGLIAAVVLALAGYFGVEHYVQQRIEGEIDTAQAELRAGGVKASRGKVGFALWSRTVTVADLAGEAAEPPLRIRLGRVVASGINPFAPGRFSAERVEATDVEVGGTMALQAGLNYAYKAPRVELVNVAGPTAPLRRLDPKAPGELYRFWLEHFAAVSASSVSAPSVSAAMRPVAANAPGAGDYSYTGLTLRELRDGKIAAFGVDRTALTFAIETAGKRDTITAEIEKLTAQDLDSAGALAMLDPARARDDQVIRVYRQVSAGAYSASSTSGMRVRLEGIAADDIGVRPSKLRFADLMALLDALPPPGTTPTPAQTRDLLEKAAGLYEGMYLGSAQLRGLAVETPDGPVRLGAIRLGKLDNGKLAELAVEELDGRAPQGPVKIGRFALKSLDIAQLLRLAGQFAQSGVDPAPEQVASLALLLEGTELTGLVAPYKDTGQPVNIDALNLSWGQFVGPIPTRARATLRMSGPVDLADPEPFRTLASTGITSTVVSADLGAAWAESARTFALEPLTLEIGNVLTAAARLSVGNVPREIFSLNPLQVAIMAAQVEAGPIELALRDTGGIDLAVAQYARAQNLSREAARRALLDNIRTSAMQMASANPDALAIAGAIARFIESPGGTLSIKLTPHRKVAAMSVIEMLRSDPLAALGQFQVEATNGR